MEDVWDVDEFDELKRRSFLQVLFKVARLANEESIARARRAADDDRIRVAHTRLFPFLSFEGVRLTSLAERVGVSKQAVQQLVDKLEEMDLVERVPDPFDGRAKLIRIGRTGKRALTHGLGVLGAFEAELADVVGTEELATTHAVLLKLLDALES